MPGCNLEVLLVVNISRRPYKYTPLSHSFYVRHKCWANSGNCNKFSRNEKTVLEQRGICLVL